MFDRIIQYGFKQDEAWKIYDHLDNSEVDKMYKLAETYELLPKITDNFKVIDLKDTENIGEIDLLHDFLLKKKIIHITYLSMNIIVMVGAIVFIINRKIKK